MAKRLYDPYLHKVVDESPADPASKLMYDTALCRLRFVDTTLGDRVYDPLMKKFRLATLLNPEPPIPDGALQFEESLEYIFFEGDLTEEHITFET